MDTASLFRERLRQLILDRYPYLRSLLFGERCQQGNLSEILPGVSSPSVATLIRLAEALEVEVKDFFIFPAQNRQHQTLALLETCVEDTLTVVLKWLTTEAKKTTKRR